MTQQSPSQVRIIDPIITRVVQGYRHAELVADTLFPRVPVYKSGGQILEFGKESFRLYSARRAPGANTGRVQFGYLGKSFSLVQDSLEGQVPREYLRDTADMPSVDLASRSANGVMRALSMTLEYDSAQLAVNAANYDVNHKVTLAGNDKWSDASTDPGTSIEAGKDAIRQSVGIYPNTLLLSAQAFSAAKNNPNVVERFKYTGRDSITTAMLANLWDLEKVVVGKAVAFDDGGASIDIWGNNAVLAYVPATPSGMEEPSFGYTYVMNGHPLAEKAYYDNNAKSWMYPVTFERVPVLSGISSGYLIKDPA